MLRLETVILSRLGDRVRTFVQRSPRYQGTMCEVLRGDADKWTAVQKIAAAWGIEPEAICTVGDDANDLPMILGAGVGVAMGHASESIKYAADWTTTDNEHDGVARCRTYSERMIAMPRTLEDLPKPSPGLAIDSPGVKLDVVLEQGWHQELAVPVPALERSSLRASCDHFANFQ